MATIVSTHIKIGTGFEPGDIKMIFSLLLDVVAFALGAFLVLIVIRTILLGARSNTAEVIIAISVVGLFATTLSNIADESGRADKRQYVAVKRSSRRA
jgi:hypothetical protein